MLIYVFILYSISNFANKIDSEINHVFSLLQTKLYFLCKKVCFVCLFTQTATFYMTWHKIFIKIGKQENKHKRIQNYMAIYTPNQFVVLLKYQKSGFLHKTIPQTQLNLRFSDLDKRRQNIRNQYKFLLAEESYMTIYVCKETIEKCL